MSTCVWPQAAGKTYSLGLDVILAWDMREEKQSDTTMSHILATISVLAGSLSTSITMSRTNDPLHLSTLHQTFPGTFSLVLSQASCQPTKPPTN